MYHLQRTSVRGCGALGQIPGEHWSECQVDSDCLAPLSCYNPYNIGSCLTKDEIDAVFAYCSTPEGSQYEVCGGAAPMPTEPAVTPGGGGTVPSGGGTAPPTGTTTCPSGDVVPAGQACPDLGGGAPVEPPPEDKKILGMNPLVLGAVGVAALVGVVVLVKK